MLCDGSNQPVWLQTFQFIITLSKRKCRSYWAIRDTLVGTLVGRQYTTPLTLDMLGKNSALHHHCTVFLYFLYKFCYFSSYIRLDIIRRILEKYLNTNIVQVMCVTNIDDKIIERSKSTNTCWKELTVNYEKEFFSDLAVLNVKSPSVITRAVDFVPQIIRFIEHLLAKNLAYRSCDGEWIASGYDLYNVLFVPTCSKFPLKHFQVLFILALTITVNMES